eukprot:TRINITY_DN3280_c0_g2_i1.p1 TRINITY_DN3280_c0_g2~~TRINITY_DN3280_c0_g2_i1.p1  ORF type:complete len:338 (+),score=110.40 TRINITY_DN3280_c0_g2_i1:149-1162(+)
MEAIPASRRAWCYDPAARKGDWQDVDIPSPIPENFVLIRVEAAAVHPIDFAHMGGLFGFGMGPGPHILGTEGAGIVVANGPGKGAGFLGKRVAVNASRPAMWANYAVVHVNDCIVIDDPSITPEEAALAASYPLSAMMFLSLARKLNAKAVASNAANSILGRMTSRLLQNNNIEVINLVRKAEKAAQIQEEGARHVINTSEAGWENQFKELSQKLGVSLLLECIGGETLTQLATLSPPGTTVCLYGSKSDKPGMTINLGDLFQGKILMAASVFNYWAELSADEKAKVVATINRELKTTFRTQIIRTIPFENVNEALAAYGDNLKFPATDGKFILRWA